MNVCDHMYEFLCPDGIKPVPGSCGGHESTERGSREEGQHSHPKISTSNCQQQVPTVSAGTSGEDGEVDNFDQQLNIKNYHNSHKNLIRLHHIKDACLLFHTEENLDADIIDHFGLFFSSRCNPYFVRCIKPNNMKVDGQTSIFLLMTLII